MEENAQTVQPVNANNNQPPAVVPIINPIVKTEQVQKLLTNQKIICPKCKNTVDAFYYFCPSCGHKLKSPPLSTSVGRQIYIYLFSVLLPPLGLFPAIKYLRQPNSKSKKVGVAIIVITILSVVITFWFSIQFFNSFSKELNSQLNVDNSLQY